MDEPKTPATWRQPRTLAEATDLFRPDVKVRHLNPLLGDWRGAVAVYAGRWVEGDTQRPMVYVRWTHPEKTPASWYTAECIEPVTDEQG
jgi:hypothetical protein